jgi:hypothetical protein
MQASVTHIKLFIKFAAKELGLRSYPIINLVGSSENKMDAFGHSQGNKITVRITDRHPIDIMRTIAHELMHYKQNITKKKIGNEDQANEIAGRIMRKFDIKYPHVFKDKAVKANMMEDGMGGGMTTSALPANRMGGSSSTAGTGGIDTYDPLLKIKSPLKRKSASQPWDHQFKMNSPKYNYTLSGIVPKKLSNILGRDLKNEKRSDRK